MTVAHTIEEAETLNTKLASLNLAERLSFVAGLGGRVVFTTSLGIEDQVITAEIGNHRLPIDVVTLQTGRLFPKRSRCSTRRKSSTTSILTVTSPSRPTSTPMRRSTASTAFTRASKPGMPVVACAS
jgi:3'-phosphoadenosine 5'-phosphosulfate sulfotransferase (PAPS reductase)/FAD synthetase